MVSWLINARVDIHETVFFEVGTGHKPLIPIYFSLMGARKFITVDLNRRLDIKLVKGVLQHLLVNRESLEDRWSLYVPAEILQQRFDLLARYKDDPLSFFKQVGLDYYAPADARNIPLPDGSVDCHMSNTVLEHIPGNIVHELMVEARRLLNNDGIALHFIDLSDHFQHQDSSISPLNFLKFSDQKWSWIAHNEYAYTNRLRPNDFLSIFKKSGFSVLRKEIVTDKTLARDNIQIDSKYLEYSEENLLATEMNVLLQGKND
jgi:SAM-dependent methyltransferase